MKALSIHQPWAWAILHAGKGVENRTWRTAHRGPLLVHASRSQASHDRERGFDWPRRYGVRLPAWEEFATGAVVGVVDVIDCVRLGWVSPERMDLPGYGPSRWATGPWCWVLADPRPLPEPVPFRGAQRLFDAPDDLIPVALR